MYSHILVRSDWLPPCQAKCTWLTVIHNDAALAHFCAHSPSSCHPSSMLHECLPVVRRTSRNRVMAGRLCAIGQDRKRIILGRTMASERRTSGKNFFFERKKVKKRFVASKKVNVVPEWSLYCVTFHCVPCYWCKSADFLEVDNIWQQIVANTRGVSIWFLESKNSKIWRKWAVNTRTFWKCWISV